MAVYTHVSEKDLAAFLQNYNLGEYVSHEGIEQGVENTNYHVFTDQGRYILTLFENRVDPFDLPFFFAFTDHLAGKGIACPETVAARNGEIILELNGRSAALITFLEGSGVDPADITPDHCAQIGTCLGEMHLAAQDFSQSRPNTVGLSEWRRLAARTRGRANEVVPGLANIIDGELDCLEQNWPLDLPVAAVHADLFPDNVFFLNGRLSGVIDFYFTATEALAYDFAITVNAWCFDDENRLVRDRLDRLKWHYEEKRTLNARERESMPLLCRGAAMRILLTRLHDWVFHPDGALVKPKDPREYLEKLLFHRDDGINWQAKQ